MNVHINDKELIKLYEAGSSRKLRIPENVIDKFFATIQKIESATSILDFWKDSGLKFEKLKGFKNRYSIRLTGKYRLETEINWGKSRTDNRGIYHYENLFSLWRLTNKNYGTDNSIKSSKEFGPGYFIQEQMDFRHWIQEDLADVYGGI